MDSLLLVLLAVIPAAFCAGTVLADWRQRAAALSTLEAAAADMRKTTAEIATAHNGLAQQLLGLQDQINSHELRLSGQAQKGPSPWTAASMVRPGAG